MNKINERSISYDQSNNVLMIDLSGMGSETQYFVDIVVAEDRNGPGDIATVDISNGTIEEISVTPVELVNPVWWIYVVDGTYDSDVILENSEPDERLRMFEQLEKDIEECVSRRLEELDMGNYIENSEEDA